jgi:ADP-heptose:LPS heptosyltransferase
MLDNYAGRLGIAIVRPAAMLLGLVLRRDHHLSVDREIVWVKMLGGGSLLLAGPMLLGMRRAYPNAKMVLITTPTVKPFAELTGAFDEYRVIDDRSAMKILWSAASALFRTLRADCIVDLEVHSRLTTVFTTLTMARNRIGFWLEDIYWRRGLASHLIFFNRSSASYHFYDRVADLFSVAPADREVCRTALIEACGQTTAPARTDGVVSIGFACSELGRERMLTPAQWVRVFEKHLLPTHHTFNFLGGPGDRVTADAIVAAISSVFPQLTLNNCCGKYSLRQSVLALFEAPDFWGVDSSLLHLARITGACCISYWGPTDPATRLRPDNRIQEIAIYRKIACSPCVHTSEEPPCCGDNRCIKGLFGEDVPLGWTPIEMPPRRGTHGATVTSQ